MAKKPRVVSAVGISVNTKAGQDVSRRLEQAMADEVNKCIAEGISPDEANSAIIRERMLAAYQRTLAEIESQRG